MRYKLLALTMPVNAAGRRPAASLLQRRYYLFAEEFQGAHGVLVGQG